MKYSEFPYKRTNMDDLSSQVNGITERFNAAGSGTEQLELIAEVNNLFAEVDSYYSIAHLNFSRDTRDKDAIAEMEYYENLEPAYKEISVNWARTVLSSKFIDELKMEFGDHFFNLKELELKTFDPAIKDFLLEELNLKNKYTKLMSGAQIEFKGSTYNLTGLGPFFTDDDRETRKDAHHARDGFFLENADELDKIYDDLVKVRHNMARELGYENYIQLGYVKMGRTDYDYKMVASYREQIIQHVVPLAAVLHDRKKEILGLDHLYWWDKPNFKSGNPKPKGTPDELVEAAQEMYRKLSPETGEFFDMMVNDELMDLVNREGKSGGGFCTSFPKYDRPYIFSNFNGTDHDVTVLTHEAGHAFQCYSSRHQPILEYLWPTMEAAEIHSMSMEFITWPWMEYFFKEDTEKFKYLHILKSLTFLPYGACVDHFQHWVYENPEATPAERKAQWSGLEKTYLPDRDYGDLASLHAGGFWQGQSHIYHSPFYYIDYTLAQVCAFQFWSKFNKDRQDAWTDYLRLCKTGGSQPFTELLKTANLKSPFDPGVLEEVVNDVWAWLELVDVSTLESPEADLVLN